MTTYLCDKCPNNIEPANSQKKTFKCRIYPIRISRYQKRKNHCKGYIEENSNQLSFDKKQHSIGIINPKVMEAWLN